MRLIHFFLVYRFWDGLAYFVCSLFQQSIVHIVNINMQVSIVAMSGAVGEALVYEVATGGASDLDNLGQIMGQTNPPMDGPAQQSQARCVFVCGAQYENGKDNVSGWH